MFFTHGHVILVRYAVEHGASEQLGWDEAGYSYGYDSRVYPSQDGDDPGQHVNGDVSDPQYVGTVEVF